MNTKVLHITNPTPKLLQVVKRLQQEKEEKLREFKSKKLDAKQK